MKILKNLSIKKKLGMEFLFTLMIILFIGLLSFNSMNKFNENNLLQGNLVDLTKELNNQILNLFLLVETENLQDFSLAQSEVEFGRNEYDLLYSIVKPDMEEFGMSTEIEKNMRTFIKTSDRFMKTHENMVIKNDEFIEKAQTEKSIRHNTRDLALELNDL